jgi:3-hydroxymyristoyl/3-hydroxydecanoyl-(acyl carrier protein) dehydratase
MKIIILFLEELLLLTQSFYVLSVDRAKFKGSIFPGTLDLRINSAGVLLI